jgi:4-hydroxybenzoate polyprenyltransferase
MREPSTSGQVVAASSPSPSLEAHFQIARVDHWVKNVFVLPGIVVALALDRTAVQLSLLPTIVLGLLSTCLVASSNYVINEVLDAPSDRSHPTKCHRPVPSDTMPGGSIQK